jgi:Holliday junction DNA helicase RuvA
MIASIEGRLAGIEQDAVVVQVGGLGFRVHVPATFLKQCGAVGSSISLYTYLHVRETELTLYGCATQDELHTFKLLLGVSGVGPKVGLAMLSNLPLDSLHSAIANEQTNILSQVPGIGTKTAQKIILDLKDKVRAVSGIAPPAPEITEQDAEVIAALVSLGYSVVEAQMALQNVPLTVQGVEERLRAALSYLGL